VPIASVLGYLQGLLNGLPMPGSLPPMDAYALPPPDPNVQSEIPAVYIWPTDFGESRNTFEGGSSMPRNTGLGTFSGVKRFNHEPHLFIVWMGADDDPSFPGIVDFAMKALRFAYPMPTIVTDPNDGTQSQVNDVGEVQRGQIFVRALEDEAFLRYDCELTVPVIEEISA
jgi:hypothetical protein